MDNQADRLNEICPRGSGPGHDREREQMPQPSVRRADLLSRVGTLLSTSFDAGIPLRDVQEAASHADPRTTMRYDRARTSPDRNATYIVAAYVAGAAR
jgi:hypothetical protein